MQSAARTAPRPGFAGVDFEDGVVHIGVDRRRTGEDDESDGTVVEFGDDLPDLRSDVFFGFS